MAAQRRRVYCYELRLLAGVSRSSRADARMSTNDPLLTVVAVGFAALKISVRIIIFLPGGF